MAVFHENKSQVVLPASLVPAELRLEDEGTGLGSCSRAVLLSKASMLPTEKEQLTFLSMPKISPKIPKKLQKHVFAIAQSP